MTTRLVVTDELTERTTDPEGRLTVGKQHAGSDVLVVVFENNEISDWHSGSVDKRGRVNLGSEHTGESMEFVVLATRGDEE